LGTALFRGSRRDDEGVGRAEFAKEWNGRRPRVRATPQSTTGRHGTSESHRLQGGRVDEGDAGLKAKDEAEQPFGSAPFLGAANERVETGLAGGGVRGVGLDDHGTARGEGRGGVAAGHGEGEGKVRTAKDADRSQRHAHSSKVG